MIYRLAGDETINWACYFFVFICNYLWCCCGCLIYGIGMYERVFFVSIFLYCLVFVVLVGSQ